MPLLLGLIVLAVVVILAFWLTANLIGVLFTLIVAGLVGWLADLIVPGNFPWGWLGAIIAGLIGSWIGVALFGNFGPTLAGISIVPAIIGAIILAFLVSIIGKAMSRSRGTI